MQDDSTLWLINQRRSEASRELAQAKNDRVKADLRVRTLEYELDSLYLRAENLQEAP